MKKREKREIHIQCYNIQSFTDSHHCHCLWLDCSSYFTSRLNSGIIKLVVISNHFLFLTSRGVSRIFHQGHIQLFYGFRGAQMFSSEWPQSSWTKMPPMTYFSSGAETSYLKFLPWAYIEEGIYPPSWIYSSGAYAPQLDTPLLTRLILVFFIFSSSNPS